MVHLRRTAGEGVLDVPVHIPSAIVKRDKATTRLTEATGGQQLLPKARAVAIDNAWILVLQIESLLRTTPQLARKLALKYLNSSERVEIARYIFPLVYVNDGVISATGRRRFKKVCSVLQLENGSATELSNSYRKKLDAQWSYINNLVAQLNQFADKLSFDHREMEILRE